MLHTNGEPTESSLTGGTILNRTSAQLLELYQEHKEGCAECVSQNGGSCKLTMAMDIDKDALICTREFLGVFEAVGLHHLLNDRMIRVFLLGWYTGARTQGWQPSTSQQHAKAWDEWLAQAEGVRA